jgi:hypothetical protein
MKIIFSTSSPGDRESTHTRRNHSCPRELQHLDQLADLGALFWQENRSVRRSQSVVAELPAIDEWAFELGCREAGRCGNQGGPEAESPLDNNINKLKTKAGEAAAMERDMPRKKRIPTYAPGRPGSRVRRERHRRSSFQQKTARTWLRKPNECVKALRRRRSSGCLSARAARR